MNTSPVLTCVSNSAHLASVSAVLGSRLVESRFSLSSRQAEVSLVPDTSLNWLYHANKTMVYSNENTYYSYYCAEIRPFPMENFHGIHSTVIISPRQMDSINFQQSVGRGAEFTFCLDHDFHLIRALCFMLYRRASTLYEFCCDYYVFYNTSHVDPIDRIKTIKAYCS